MNFSFSWLDIAIMVVLALYMISGYKEGLIKGIMQFVAIVVSFLAAKLFGERFCVLLTDKTQIDEKVLKIVTDKIAPSVEGTGGSNIGLIGKMFEKINQSVSAGNAAVAETITASVMNIISFVLIFIIVWILLMILSSILQKFAELPVIKSFNHLGGMIIGLVKGIIVLVVILNAAYYLNLILGLDGLTQAFDASLLMKYLYISAIAKFIIPSNGAQ